MKVYFFGKSNKLILLMYLLCCFIYKTSAQLTIKEYSTVTTGAQQIDLYLSKLKNKRVAVLTNVTGKINNTTLVDTLLSLKIKVVKIFGPEHGFRGDTEAGDKVGNGIDIKTGLTVISLYGKNKKPTREQLKDIDIIVYDIQDVGVRFYTYISTMCYAMEACAENKKEMLILDRPNPNGFYIDGPVLKNEFKGFLGLHNIPIVYGMTCGEYAKMANSEGWLTKKLKCNLTIIPLKNYDRKCSYKLPYPPSPNLPNEKAVLLYPSLGLFEGTLASVGRGTDFPFQVLGLPKLFKEAFEFTPMPTKLSNAPKYSTVTCYGFDLRGCDYLKKHPKQINLFWLKELLSRENKDLFFDKNFNYHAGNTELQQQLKEAKTEIEIRNAWQTDIETFKKIRKKYLIYEEF